MTAPNDVASPSAHSATRLTADDLRAELKPLIIALNEAIDGDRNWENALLDLAVFLNAQAIPALTVDGREPPADLLAHADRLPMVQDPLEAELIADHVWRLLDQLATESPQ